MITGPLITIVDDDDSVRESLPDLLMELGFAVHAFSSREEFLASDSVRETKCLLLDVDMPSMSGPGLQLELRRRQQEIPIVFITANCNETLRAQLISNGAVECLFKPFSDSELLDALKNVLERSSSI